MSFDWSAGLVRSRRWQKMYGQKNMSFRFEVSTPIRNSLIRNQAETVKYLFLESRKSFAAGRQLSYIRVQSQNLIKKSIFPYQTSLTDTGLSWPLEASRFFARKFSHARNKSPLVLNIRLTQIDIVSILLVISKKQNKNKL